MIVEFENALIEKYIPYLVEGLKQVIFAQDEQAFNWSEQIKKYPCVLVYREDMNDPLVTRYDVSDEKGNVVHAYPFNQVYRIRVFLEKESGMLNRRTQMRALHAKEPYVDFELATGDPVSIGLWLQGIKVESVRDNYDSKGAKRCVTMDVLAHLVMDWDEKVPEIQKVIVRMTPNGQQVKVIREII